MAAFSTLCTRFQRYARMDATRVGSVPTWEVLTGARDEEREIGEFINDAYRMIQQMSRDWRFRRLRGTFAMSAADRSYTRAEIISNTSSLFDRILTFRDRNIHDQYILSHLTATGTSDHQPVTYIDYAQWRGWEDRGDRPSGRPDKFTILPDLGIEVDPTPDAAYTITFDYLRQLHDLVTSSDEPILPNDSEDVIVWRAIMLYCASRSGTGETLAKAELEYKRLLAALRREELPSFTCAALDRYA